MLRRCGERQHGTLVYVGRPPARRIYKQLRREGHVVARCTVARMMADMGLRGVQRGKKRYTTTPDATAARPPDLVDRRFGPVTRIGAGS